MTNDELADRIEKLDVKMDGLKSELGTFKVEVWKHLSALMVKAGVWGLAGGAMPVVVLLLVYWLKILK